MPAPPPVASSPATAPTPPATAEQDGPAGPPARPRRSPSEETGPVFLDEDTVGGGTEEPADGTGSGNSIDERAAAAPQAGFGPAQDPRGGWGQEGAPSGRAGAAASASAPQDPPPQPQGGREHTVGLRRSEVLRSDASGPAAAAPAASGSSAPGDSPPGQSGTSGRPASGQPASGQSPFGQQPTGRDGTGDAAGAVGNPGWAPSGGPEHGAGPGQGADRHKGTVPHQAAGPEQNVGQGAGPRQGAVPGQGPGPGSGPAAGADSGHGAGPGQGPGYTQVAGQQVTGREPQGGRGAVALESGAASGAAAAEAAAPAGERLAPVRQQSPALPEQRDASGAPAPLPGAGQDASVPPGTTPPVRTGEGVATPSWSNPAPHQQQPQLQQQQQQQQQPVAPWRPPVDDPFSRALAQEARPAELGKRLGARLLDLVLTLAVGAAVAFPFVGRTVDHIQAKIDAVEQAGVTKQIWLVDGTTGLYLALVVGTLLVFGLLYEVMPTARWGRTLGKKLFGLSVVNIEGHGKPGFGSSLLRWLVHGVLGVLVVGLVNVVWCLFDRPWRQCWHDKVAGTFVAKGNVDGEVRL